MRRKRGYKRSSNTKKRERGGVESPHIYKRLSLIKKN
jgi:hypothetical protein